MKPLCLIGIVLLAGCHPVHHGYGKLDTPIVPQPDKPAVTDPPVVMNTNLPPVERGTPSPNQGSTEPHVEPKKDIAAIVTWLNEQLQDAFFDYDRSEPRPDAMTALHRDAELLGSILADFPKLKVIVEGHCDERGSAEYNMALGARRAERTVEVLKEFAVPLPELQTITYGKEAPQCIESTEQCWRRNRRAHLTATAGGF